MTISGYLRTSDLGPSSTSPGAHYALLSRLYPRCMFLALAAPPHLASTITTPLPKRAGLHTQDGIANFNAKRVQTEHIAAYVPARPSLFALISLYNSGYSELQSGFTVFEKNASAPYPLAPPSRRPTCATLNLVQEMTY